MRYSIYVDSFHGKAQTLDDAISMMASKMWFQRLDVREQVESSGIGRAVFGFTTGEITDHEWVDLTLSDPEERARCAVRELYGDDGVLEVDEGGAVLPVESGYQVQVWLWVSDDDAGITEEMDDEADMEQRYVAAAEHPVAEFDASATASMGCDPGAYVCGWIHITLHPNIAAEAV